MPNEFDMDDLDFGDLDLDFDAPRKPKAAKSKLIVPDGMLEVEAQSLELVSDTKRMMDAERAKTKMNVEDNGDANFFTCIIFQSKAQRNEFLEKIGATKLQEAGGQYVDGLRLAKLLGVQIDAPTPQRRVSKGSKRLAGLALSMDDLAEFA